MKCDSYWVPANRLTTSLLVHSTSAVNYSLMMPFLNGFLHFGQALYLAGRKAYLLTVVLSVLTTVRL